MRKKFDKFRIQVFILLVLLPFGCFVYGASDVRGNIYLPSTSLILENFDKDDSFLDPPDQLKAVPSDSFFSGKSSPFGIFSYKDFIAFPFQVFLFEQKEILRC